MRGCLTLLVLLLTTQQVHGAEPAIRTIANEGRTVAVAVTNLSRAELQQLSGSDEALKSALTVRVLDDSAAADVPAMAGSYSVRGEEIRFSPRFAFRPGLKYRAAYVSALPGKSPLTHDFTIPEPALAVPTRVEVVYPTADELPENQLKFYLHFSAPMGRGEAYEHVQLLRASGEPVDLPFLEIGEELWDASGRRLTLLIDPGRIKQGVKPREDIGPALVAGKSFTLVINRAWRDAQNNPLAGEYKKQFKVGPPISVAIDYKAWDVNPPAAGTRDPLVVEFPRPLDRALLERTLTVLAPNGKPVAGAVEISNHERRWAFRPNERWPAGEYAIAVDTVLEDLAGNRIGSAFEVDQLTPLEKKVEAAILRIPFTIE